MASPQQINPYERPDVPSRGKIIAVALVAVSLHIMAGFLGLVILPSLGAVLPDCEPTQIVVVRLIERNVDVSTPTDANVTSGQEPEVPAIPQNPVENEPEKIESPTELIDIGLKTPEKTLEIEKNKTPPPVVAEAKIDESKATPKKLAKTLDDEINECLERVKNEVAMRENNGLDSENANLNLENHGQKIHPEKMEYYTHIRDIVYSNWVLSSENLSANLSATFQIRIEPNGAISKVGLMASSGNPDYDLSVKRAIDKSSPFHPLPPIFGGLADSPGMQFETDEFKKSKQQ